MNELPTPSDLSDPPVPTGVDSPEAYVAALRALRAWSGFTYRQLARRAEGRGDTLPHSTLAAAFARPSLPRTDMVAAFIRACGLDDETTAEWLRVYRRVAAGQVEPPAVAVQEAGPPVRTARRTGRTGVYAGFGGAVMVVIVIAAAWAVTMGHDSSAGKTPALVGPDVGAVGPPRAAAYRLRVARSGLCLSERRGSGSGHLYEAPCDDQFPAMALEDLGNSVYLVTTDHPEFGPGCMGVPFASTTDGAEVEDGACGKGAVEQYRWEAVTSPAAGFRIHPTHSGMCLGYPAGSVVGSSTLRQLRCDSSPGQIFQLI